MPIGNGKGPMGKGPMTGTGRGCGFGGGRGGAHQGRGRHGNRNMFLATGLPGWMRVGGGAAPSSVVVTEAEKQALRDHAAALQSELDLINKRLSEFETNYCRPYRSCDRCGAGS